MIVPSADCSTNPCTVSNFVWSSYASFDRTTVSVLNTTQRFCFNCNYIIGILSGDNTRAADYSIVIGSTGATTTLSSGVSVNDQVAQQQYRYYRIAMPSQVDVEINVVPFYGDPDIYVSWDPTNQFPDRSHKNASSESMYNDTVYVQVRKGCTW